MDDPDYVPTINMGYDHHTTYTPLAKMQRYERVVSRRNRQLAVEEEQEKHGAASTLLELSACDGINADVETSPHSTQFNGRKYKSYMNFLAQHFYPYIHLILFDDFGKRFFYLC